MNKTLLHSIAASCTLLFALSTADAAVDASIARQTSPSGIAYASGGVGDARQDAMEAIRKDYNLQLTFARPKSGDYVIDVKVKVENAKHENVLEVVSSGPLFFASLPAGKYTVTADAEGQPQTRRATISKRHTSALVFYFPERN